MLSIFFFIKLSDWSEITFGYVSDSKKLSFLEESENKLPESKIRELDNLFGWKLLIKKENVRESNMRK